MTKIVLSILIFLLTGAAFSADLLLDTAVDISTNTSSFNGVCAVTDTNVQMCLNKVDDHTHTSATIADEYLKNSGGDVGTGNYTFTGNISVGDGDGDNPQINFVGTTIKYIYFDQTRNALVINAGKVIIE